MVDPPRYKAATDSSRWEIQERCAKRALERNLLVVLPTGSGKTNCCELAMMRLFGGFSNEVFDSYHHAYPLEAGHQDRVKLYQLYPLLVHVVLFGGGYVSSVNRVLDQYT